MCAFTAKGGGVHFQRTQQRKGLMWKIVDVSFVCGVDSVWCSLMFGVELSWHHLLRGLSLSCVLGSFVMN